jgi:hypothetical protein
MADVVIQAEGAEAEIALTEPEAFFRGEFGAAAETRREGGEGVRRGIDPAWLAVYLSIPSAVLATMDLAARLKLVERTEAMLVRMRAALGGATCMIRIGACRSFDLATAKARDIIDALREEDGGGR